MAEFGLQISQVWNVPGGAIATITRHKIDWPDRNPRQVMNIHEIAGECRGNITGEVKQWPKVCILHNCITPMETGAAHNTGEGGFFLCLRVWWRHYTVKRFPHHSLWGNHRWPVDSPYKGTVMRLFDISLNKLLDKQSRSRWFKTPWPACDVIVKRIDRSRSQGKHFH